jgi:hypothetical protein
MWRITLKVLRVGHSHAVSQTNDLSANRFIFPFLKKITAGIDSSLSVMHAVAINTANQRSMHIEQSPSDSLRRWPACGRHGYIIYFAMKWKQKCCLKWIEIAPCTSLKIFSGKHGALSCKNPYKIWKKTWLGCLAVWRDCVSVGGMESGIIAADPPRRMRGIKDATGMN